MADLKFEIKEHIGLVSEDNGNWTKEINLVSWNGREAKYDIRSWDPQHFMMSRGVTFTEEELIKLYEILKVRYEEK